jgi:GH25 family lysozyme M1 (1,4-beta-N-acetylmuramidase)
MSHRVALLLCCLTWPSFAWANLCPGPVTVDGIDVSYWQSKIDWSKVKTTKKYAIIRTGDGLYQDKLFAVNWKGCHDQGLICGVYQFFRPGKDPIVQADLMLSMMGPLKPGDLAPMIDVEATDGQPPAVVAAKVTQWVNHVKQKTGRDPLVYTGKYFWDGNVKSSAQANLPLVHAQYCTNCCPKISTYWKKWTIWQFSSTGSVPGIGGNCDLDLYDGPLSALQKLASAQTCKPSCDKAVWTGADCGKVDCAKSAATCVDDSLGARCVSNACPAVGEATVCLPDPKNGKIGTCKNGALTTGDCAPFAAYCSTAGGQKAHCASGFCVKSATEVPVPHDVCLPDGKRYHCDAAGVTQAKPCTTGETCAMVNGGAVCQGKCKAHCEGGNVVGDDCGVTNCGKQGGACVADGLGVRCVHKDCPPQGNATVCVDEPLHSKIGACKNGALSMTGECSSASGWCSTATTTPMCVSNYCAAAFDQPPVAKDVCLPGGQRFACTADGQLAEKPCPGGQSCVVSNGVASCANTCKPKCDNGFLVDAACNKLDCKVQAGQCVDDELGARCASLFCPAKGKTTACMDFLSPKQVFSCQDGQLQKSSCAAGQICNQTGGAHCVDAVCVTNSSDAPVERDVCTPDGGRVRCDSLGLATPAPCVAGETCKDGVCQAANCEARCDGQVATTSTCGKQDCSANGSACVVDELGARCVDADCPAKGLAQTCGKEPKVLWACLDGRKVAVDCSLRGELCAQTVQGALCVAAGCLDVATGTLVDHHICTSDGRMRCTETGDVVPAPCPNGQACNACGGCGEPAPAEVCNGLDDDCDGQVDNGLPGCDYTPPVNSGSAQAGVVPVGTATTSAPASGCAATRAASTSVWWLASLLVCLVRLRQRRMTRSAA